jgi:hypothetical protein
MQQSGVQLDVLRHDDERIEAVLLGNPLRNPDPSPAAPVSRMSRRSVTGQASADRM